MPSRPQQGRMILGTIKRRWSSPSVDDPIHRLLLARDPFEGTALGPQPTLLRFENAAGHADLYRLATALTETVLTYHRERLGAGVRLITIDLDATDDPTHAR